MVASLLQTVFSIACKVCRRLRWVLSLTLVLSNAVAIGLLRNESSMMLQCSLPLPHWGLRNSYDIIRGVCIACSIVTVGIAQYNDIMRKRPIGVNEM